MINETHRIEWLAEIEGSVKALETVLGAIGYMAYSEQRYRENSVEELGTMLMDKLSALDNLLIILKDVCLRYAGDTA